MTPQDPPLDNYPPHDHEVFLRDSHREVDDFRKRNPLGWWFTLAGPAILTLSLLILLWVFTSWQFACRLIASTFLSVWVLGRFIILTGSEGPVHNIAGSLTSGQLFLLLSYLDIMTALLLAFHIGFLFRLPWIGPRVATLVNDGQFILNSQPWMRRAAFLGLIAFVCFPLTATGSVGGSIFGRLLGMSRIRTFVGIVIGSVLGNGLMFLLSDLIQRWVDKESPVFKYGGFGLILALVILLEWRYRQLKAASLAAGRHQDV